MYFNQDGAISSLNGKSLKFVDQFIDLREIFHQHNVISIYVLVKYELQLARYWPHGSQIE